MIGIRWQGIAKTLSIASTALAIAFMIMLIAASIALALGREVLANRFAEVAYYFLVVCILLQLVIVAQEKEPCNKDLSRSDRR